MTSIERELGNLQARMEAVEHELQAVRSDIREIRDARNQCARRLATFDRDYWLGGHLGRCLRTRLARFFHRKILKAKNMNNWPKQSDADAFYGNPRGSNVKASVLWKAQCLTHVTPPFAMNFAGTPVTRIMIHGKCADSLLRVLQAIWLASGHNQKKIDAWGVSEFGGSFNFRLMRGSNHLSMHAYGCAIDLAPQRFPMGRTLPKFCGEVLQALSDEGWVNLPRDRMHFQAAHF